MKKTDVRKGGLHAMPPRQQLPDGSGMDPLAEEILFSIASGAGEQESECPPNPNHDYGGEIGKQANDGPC
jgi:hypothetical protein